MVRRRGRHHAGAAAAYKGCAMGARSYRTGTPAGRAPLPDRPAAVTTPPADPRDITWDAAAPAEDCGGGGAAVFVGVVHGSMVGKIRLVHVGSADGAPVTRRRRRAPGRRGPREEAGGGGGARDHHFRR